MLTVQKAAQIKFCTGNDTIARFTTDNHMVLYMQTDK